MLFETTLQLSFCLSVVMVTGVWCHGSEGTPGHHGSEGTPGHHGSGGPPGHHGFDKESIEDKEHMKEHLKDQIGTDEKPMSVEEMQFHYFKLHDYDNNNMLDGTELVKAMTHHQREDPQNSAALNETVLTGYIDAILSKDDLNNNGYIEYPEYMIAIQSRSG